MQAAPIFERAHMTESPAFIATFADGEITRMTTYTRLDKLNLRRGVRLARAAYESRTKHEPPAIIEARFERRGSEILASYDAKQLEGV